MRKIWKALDCKMFFDNETKNTILKKNQPSV